MGLNKILNYLLNEVHLSLGKIPTPGISHFLMGVFVYIALNNIAGLVPYIFTSTRHLRFRLSFALVLWGAVISSAVIKDLGATLAHLVPLGTPYPLIPLIVLIEIVSNLIRPITLSVRLAANMVAGHLLLALISGPRRSRNYGIFRLILVAIIVIIVLEVAVALIQAYVFITLRSLYVAEVNSISVNKN